MRDENGNFLTLLEPTEAPQDLEIWNSARNEYGPCYWYHLRFVNILDH